LIIVDLPAPFWPISACTSPGATVQRGGVKRGNAAERLADARIDRSGETDGDRLAVMSARLILDNKMVRPPTRFRQVAGGPGRPRRVG
jgi:hypothetical protein